MSNQAKYYCVWSFRGYSVTNSTQNIYLLRFKWRQLGQFINIHKVCGFRKPKLATLISISAGWIPDPTRSHFCKCNYPTCGSQQQTNGTNIRSFMNVYSSLNMVLIHEGPMPVYQLLNATNKFATNKILVNTTWWDIVPPSFWVTWPFQHSVITIIYFNVSKTATK